MLLLDKPRGLSSNTALQHARGLLNAAKAGHTGTLDPLASGLLPLCFGEATKFSQALLDAAKGYEMTLRFGAATTTGDAEGAVIAAGPVPGAAVAISAALDRFIGRMQQVPPRFAALKHQGRAYYEYARDGIEIPRAARVVEIFTARLRAYTPPDAIIDVACSKGTYVRVLGEDIAASLATVGHLVELRRTRSGPFTIEHAIGLDALADRDPHARRALLLPVDAPLGDVPRLDLDAAAATALVQGRRPPARGLPQGRFRAYDRTGALLGLVAVEGHLLRAVRLVHTERHAQSPVVEARQL